MTYPKLIAAELTELDAKAKEIFQERQRVIMNAVSACNHPAESVYELPYNLGLDRPWLVCSLCGYSEEGWGCGYTKLKHAEFEKPKRIDLEEWFMLALVRSTQSQRFGG